MLYRTSYDTVMAAADDPFEIPDFWKPSEWFRERPTTDSPLFTLSITGIPRFRRFAVLLLIDAGL